MKRFLLLGIALILLPVVLAGCGRYNTNTSHEYEREIRVSRISDQLQFSSLEEFLACYIIASESRAGGDITEFVSDWRATFTDSDLAKVVEGAGFLSLETLYLLPGIPEEFQIYRMTINGGFVNFWYLHENDLASEDTISEAFTYRRYFLFNFSRRDLEIPIDGNPMEGILRQENAAEDDLIDGRLFVQPNLFLWATHEAIFTLFTPLPSHNSREGIAMSSHLGRFARNDADYVVALTEMNTLNLSNTNELMDLIEETNLDLISRLVDELEFSSMEDFLGSYRIAQGGRAEGDLRDLVTDWNPAFTESDFADVVAGAEIASLETLYQPTNLPDGFALHRITVNERNLAFWYLHEDDLVSEEATREAMNQRRYFLFNVSRRDGDASALMEGVLQRNRASAEDLIDGKYLFSAPNMLVWTSDGAIFRLFVPLSMTEYVHDMVSFAELGVANLQDTGEVAALVGEEVMERVEELSR